MFRNDPQNWSYVVKTGAGICFRRNRKHLQGVPNDEPDDTDIQTKDPGEVLLPDGPGDAVELPVDVPAGLIKSVVYTRCGRAVRRPVKFEYHYVVRFEL